MDIYVKKILAFLPRKERETPLWGMPKTADEWLAHADANVAARGNVSFEYDLLQLQEAVRRATAAWDKLGGEAAKSDLATVASLAMRCLRNGDVTKSHAHIYYGASDKESPSGVTWCCATCGDTQTNM